MDRRGFKKLPLFGIVRGVQLEDIELLVETVIQAGLETIEIAMNTAYAAMLIQRAVKVAQRRLTIGAGTVLTLEDLEAALSAGATFIVLPTLEENVVKRCVKREIPVFPGALTPQEILRAWQAGATMVKVFPAKFFGPEYFKEIKGPFQEIELLACGGVTPQNMNDYFSCGAAAVSFGASVFKKEWLQIKNFKRIGQTIGEYVKACKKRTTG